MKKILFLLLMAGAMWFVWQHFFSLDLHDSRTIFPDTPKAITLVVNHGETLFFRNVQADTVESFLKQSGFTLTDEDMLFPAKETRLAPGMLILYTPARKMTLQADGKKETFFSSETTTENILSVLNIRLDEDDIVKPAREESVPENSTLVVTRVEIKEESKDMPIPFVTQTQEDSTLSWRKTVVKQKGTNGTRRTTYRVAYHDGKEVNRRVLSVETVEEPATQIVIQGTYIKVGKSHEGLGSWYSFTGTLSAANPWLPIGSYVRVTNKANGKSVIVRINDRGPFGPGRIIDLDKVAFQKIASLGAGVINVKMEEIIN